MLDHCIQIQSLDLTFKNIDEVNTLENQIKQFFNKEVLAELEDLFNQVCPIDTYLQIDKIELDLGRLHPDQIKSIGKETFLEAFKKSLLDYTASTKLDNQQNILIQNISSEKPVRKQSIQLQKEDIFLFFLKNAFYPVAVNFSTSTSPDYLLSEILKKPSASFYQKLGYLFQQNDFSKIRFFQSIQKKNQLKILSGLSIPENARSFLMSAYTAFEELFSFYKKTIPGFTSLSQLNSIFLKPRFKAGILDVFIKAPNTKNLALNRSDLSIETDKLINLMAEILQQTPEYFISFLIKEKANVQALKSKSIWKTVFNHLKNYKDSAAEIHTAPLQSPKKIAAQKELAQKQQKTTDRPLIEKENKSASKDGIYIKNSGLILLHPYLPVFFKTLDLLSSDGLFKNTAAAEKAVQLLHSVFSNTR